MKSFLNTLLLPSLKRLLFFLFIFMQGEKVFSQQKINIIYILADDLGYSELGCYGNRFNETPNLDKLATAGMRFTRFYAAAPVCSPYRAALMMGQYPARLKITDYLRPDSKKHLPLSHITLAEMFQANGYKTGIVGKWHLSGYKLHGAPEETLPDQHGFDEVIVSENRGIAEGTYFYPYHFNTDIQKKLPAAHEYLTDRQNAEAVDFIERNKNRPFFLYLSHYAVHTTVHGKPELVQHFKNKNGAGTSSPTKGNPDDDPYKKYPSGSKAKSNNPHLAAQLFSIDEGVGMILQKLRETGLDKNTIVIFTSDNGGETTITSNAPLRGGKSTLYEGGVREPFIIWGPGIKSGTVCNQPLANYDIYPTVKELIKAGSNAQQLDGISFAKVLRNPTKKMPARNFYWHYPLDKPHFLGGRSAGSIVSGKWKLIEFFDNNTYELYDLQNDISEVNDLSKKYSEKVNQLKKELAAWRQKVGAEMQ